MTEVTIPYSSHSVELSHEYSNLLTSTIAECNTSSSSVGLNLRGYYYGPGTNSETKCYFKYILWQPSINGHIETRYYYINDINCSGFDSNDSEKNSSTISSSRRGCTTLSQQ